MRFRNLSFLVLFLTTLAACTTEYSGITDPNIANQRLNPEKVKCKSVITTGTRIANRVCMSIRDWTRRAEEGREMAEDIQRRSKHEGVVGS